MGAWDATAFGNDDASDFAYDINGADDAVAVADLIGAAFDAVLATDHVTNDQGSVAVAAAALVAQALDPHAGLVDEDYGPDEWPGDFTPSGDLVSQAQAALDRVALADDNEWYDLWSDVTDVGDAMGTVASIREVLAQG